MDPLVALSYDGSHPEQSRALGRPVPGGSGPVLLACQDHQRNPCGRVVLGRVVDGGHRGPGKGEVAGETTLGAGRHLVPQPDVGEGAPDHDFVVSTPGSVGVEVPAAHSPGREVGARRGVRLDASRRGDVICGDGIPQLQQHPGALNVLDGDGFFGHSVEVGGPAYVGGFLVPFEDRPAWGGQRTPAFVPGEHVGVAGREHLGTD